MIDGLIIDSFAGGGGASTGIEMALNAAFEQGLLPERRYVDMAVNHDPEALALHAANHPNTKHFSKNIWQFDPLVEIGNRKVALAWFSPDCKHFSKAKGGKPVKKEIRDLAWVVPRFARQVRPDVIMLENVEEFRTWGPLTFARDETGEIRRDPKTGDPLMMPDPDRKGETFKVWTAQLRRLGYRMEWRELRACDYGAPTIRRRFFMIARRDGKKIVWPKPTHGDPKSDAVKNGELKPWRTAAEIIDWAIPCPSIFLTKEEGRAIGVKRPLEVATMDRIRKGVKRYVLDADKPFIVNLTHQGGDRNEPVDQPMNTVTGAHRGEKAVVAPVYVGVGGRMAQSPERTVDAPLNTLTAKADGAFVAPVMVPRYDDRRAGRSPRTAPADAPMQTITAGGNVGVMAAAHLTKFRANSIGSGMDEPVPTVTANSFIKRPGGAPPIGVVAAFLAQNNIDGRTGEGNPGRPADEPVSTILQSGSHQGVIASHMIDMHGGDMRMAGTDEPLRSLTAQGFHAAQVAAFLTKYYGTDQDPKIEDPLHTATAKARFGLVTVEIEGEPYIIADIGMRMLSPRELFRAQGFPEDYIIHPVHNGKRLTKTAQIRMCGNSVCPQMAEALVRANIIETVEMHVERTRPAKFIPEFPLWSEDEEAA